MPVYGSTIPKLTEGRLVSASYGGVGTSNGKNILINTLVKNIPLDLSFEVSTTVGNNVSSSIATETNVEAYDPLGHVTWKYFNSASNDLSASSDGKLRIFNDQFDYVLNMQTSTSAKIDISAALVGTSVEEPSSGSAATIAFDSAVSATGNSVSHTIGSGSNRGVYVVNHARKGTTGDSTYVIPTNVTYNGVSMTKRQESYNEDSSQAVGVSIWELLEADLPAAGSYTAAVSYSPSPDSSTISVISFEEVAGYSAIAASNTTVNTSISTNIASVEENEWVLDGAAVQLFAGSGTPGVDQTERSDRTNGSLVGTTSTKELTTPQTASMSWTFSASASRLAHALITIKPYGT